MFDDTGGGGFSYLAHGLSPYPIDFEVLLFTPRLRFSAGPDGSFVSSRACNLEVPASDPDGCAYTVF